MEKFRGVNPDYVEKLADVGIKNVEQMLKAGRTGRIKRRCRQKQGPPLDTILEFVKLSDLTRLGAVKSIRARLYYDAGIDTSKKWPGDPKKLRDYLAEFVEKTGFNGVATLPKEAKNAVASAKNS